MLNYLLTHGLTTDQVERCTRYGMTLEQVKEAVSIAENNGLDWQTGKPREEYAPAALDKAREAKNGGKFADMYDHGRYDGKDPAYAEIALCGQLAFWLYADGGKQEVDKAFRHSKMYTPKWENPDFRELVLQKAVDGCNGNFHRPVGRPKGETKEPLTIEALAKELDAIGWRVRYNIISASIEIDGYSNAESPEHILSTFPALLHSKLCDKYKNVSQQVIQDYILVIATRNRFNPVQDYLDSIKWDGKNHIDDVFDALHIPDTDALSRALIIKWFWQGLALLQNDPAAPFGADGILTLAGGQGIGKTSFFRKMSLSPKFFREGQSISDRDKDTRRRCITTWICELGEVDTTLKSDMGALKAFITSAYDEYRLPYGRTDQRNCRHTNLAATVNGTQFLIDQTGNRRFWTVPIEEIDLDALNSIDAEQVWAQVRDQYEAENPSGFRLTKAEQEMLAERNRDCEKTIKGEEEILDILADYERGKTEGPQLYRMDYITVSAFKAQHDTLRVYSTEQIGKVLSKHGIEPVRKRIDGSPARVRFLPTLIHFE